MARSLNKIMLIGNCAAEPEVRAQQSTYKVVTFTVATNDRRSNGQGGYTDTTEWHRITAWNALADVVSNYVHKGSKIYVEGRLRSQTYQDKTHPDVTHRTYEIVAENIILLDRRQDNVGGNNDYQQDVSNRPNGGWGAPQDANAYAAQNAGFNQDTTNNAMSYGQSGTQQFTQPSFANSGFNQAQGVAPQNMNVYNQQPAAPQGAFAYNNGGYQNALNQNNSQSAQNFGQNQAVTNPGMSDDVPF